jgi:hypothetical protein
MNGEKRVNEKEEKMKVKKKKRNHTRHKSP